MGWRGQAARKSHSLTVISDTTKSKGQYAVDCTVPLVSTCLQAGFSHLPVRGWSGVGRAAFHQGHHLLCSLPPSLSAGSGSVEIHRLESRDTIFWLQTWLLCITWRRLLTLCEHEPAHLQTRAFSGFKGRQTSYYRSKCSVNWKVKHRVGSDDVSLNLNMYAFLVGGDINSNILVVS